jgi:hypothetical protein
MRNHLAARLAIVITFLSAICGNAATPTGPSLQKVQRRYIATAYITVLSIPIFSRTGVGLGYASAEEQLTGSESSLSLRFLSGSLPERAHGLNRFGFIQETVQQKDAVMVSARYFGLMTASGEESISDAKKALEAKTGDTVPFVAAQAFINPSTARYSVRHMLLPAGYRESNADQLLNQVEAEFALAKTGEPEKSLNLNGELISTFLCSVRRAIETGDSKFDNRLVYNGKTFRFHAEKHLDPKVGEELRKSSIVATSDRVTALAGTIRNEKTNEATNFRLWYEQGSPNFLPLRFDFKPKSYLRLVFDADPHAPAERTGSASLSLNRGPK